MNVTVKENTMPLANLNLWSGHSFAQAGAPEQAGFGSWMSEYIHGKHRFWLNEQQLIDMWVNVGLKPSSSWVPLEFFSVPPSTKPSTLQELSFIMATFGRWMRFLKKSLNYIFKPFGCEESCWNKVLLPHCRLKQRLSASFWKWCKVGEPGSASKLF